MGKDDRKNPNDEFPAIDGADAPSRLGKEAKLGIAVIGLLLLTLGAVLAWRMMSPSPQNPMADASGPIRPKTSDKDDLFPKDITSNRYNRPTTVVATKPSSKPDTDLWKVTSDPKRPKPSPAAPPSFASTIPSPPEPPKAERAHRYHGASSRDSLSPKPLRESGKDAFAVADDTIPSARPARKPSLDSSDGFSMAESAPAPPPQRPRFNPPPPPAPPSFSNDDDRPASRLAVRSYDSDNYRRDPAPKPAANFHRPKPSSYTAPAPRRDDGKYEVQPNDSYWTISEKLYGSGAYFKALAQHNNGRELGEELHPGMLIQAPELGELEKSYPDLCPKSNRREAMASQNQSRISTVSSRNSHRGGRSYTVIEGDTLFNIARYELGKASRWAEIYDMNRDTLGKDFNYLTPGTQLVLPDGDKPDITAQPPARDIRR